MNSLVVFDVHFFLSGRQRVLPFALQLYELFLVCEIVEEERRVHSNESIFKPKDLLQMELGSCWHLKVEDIASSWVVDSWWTLLLQKDGKMLIILCKIDGLFCDCRVC